MSSHQQYYQKKRAYCKQNVFIWATGLLRATPLRYCPILLLLLRAFVIAIVYVRAFMHTVRGQKGSVSCLDRTYTMYCTCSFTCSPFMASAPPYPHPHLLCWLIPVVCMYPVHSVLLPFHLCHLHVF